jgi:hypothetical protein
VKVREAKFWQRESVAELLYEVVQMHSGRAERAFLDRAVCVCFEVAVTKDGERRPYRSRFERLYWPVRLLVKNGDPVPNERHYINAGRNFDLAFFHAVKKAAHGLDILFGSIGIDIAEREEATLPEPEEPTVEPFVFFPEGRHGITSLGHPYENRTRWQLFGNSQPLR